jgi:hypothetical protein
MDENQNCETSASSNTGRINHPSIEQATESETCGSRIIRILTIN